MAEQSFTYAGVPLMVPPLELYKWVEENIPFDANNYFRTLNYGMLDNSEIVFKNYSENPFSNLKLSSLYWPTGASRFATGFFLASSEDLEKLPKFDNLGYSDSIDTLGGIRSRVNGTGAYSAQKLEIYNTENPFAAKMWMLPPRPLVQIDSPIVSDAIQTRGRFPIPHLESLWVIPLVDDRYWWWWHNTGEFKLPSCSSWQDLFFQLFSNMGYGAHEILVDDIPEEYLFPHKLYKNQSFNIRVPLLLDSIAQSCNCRIIFHYHGQVEVMHARQSFDTAKKVRLTPAGVGGGGKMVLANMDKSKLHESFPRDSDIGKNGESVKKQTPNVRDTPGVIPEVVTFVINNNPVRVNLANRNGDLAERAKSETTKYGDDVLNTQIIQTLIDPQDLDSVVQGRVRYFEDLSEQLDGPVDRESETQYYSTTGSKIVEHSDGDYIYDTKNNIRYGPKSSSGWGDAERGISLLSKYFKIEASSYKTAGKNICPVNKYPVSGVTDKNFNVLQIENFCKTYARDWALYQYADDDLTLNGCVPIEQHGLMDHAIFHLSVNDTYTRIIRPPYNDLTEELYIESYLGDEAACDADTYECGQCKGMQGDSVTTQLYGFGTSDMFLPYSAIKAKTQTVPTAATPATYPWWHKPPYVVKFCLGGAIGTVALDYHFQTSMNVSVYWNGEKVASRLVYGSKSFTCQSGAQSWGRLTFYKTEKTPSYAIVVVDADQSTFGLQEAERPQAMNWYLNMRCVDSIPYPAPRAIACDSKLNEIGGVYTLGMFTSIPVNIPGTSNGIVPNTPICVSDSASSSFTCSNGTCVVPAKLSLSFVNPPSSCKFLKDVTIPLQQSSSEGGWIGIYDLFGPTKDIIQARLSMVGTSSFKLVLKDIVNTSRQTVEINNITTCLCTPFRVTIPNVNLTPFSCTPASPNNLQILIKEA